MHKYGVPENNKHISAKEGFNMTEKNSIAPEARQALIDFKMEMSDELGIQTHNNMSKSEYPVNMNRLNGGNSLDNELHNHDIY